MQAEVDIIILGGMGLKYDDYLAFRNTLDEHGALSRSVLFIHTASDPIVECMLVPDMCLAVAEQYALQNKRVLVLLTDMTNWSARVLPLTCCFRRLSEPNGSMRPFFR